MTLLSTPKHRVSIVVDGRQIGGWDSYRIATSLTDPVDTFDVRCPFRRDVWDLVRPDRPVQVLIDDTPVITGFIDDSERPPGESTISVVGRCKIGRLYDDAAPSINFGGLAASELFRHLAFPFFERVTLSGARDRNLRRGKGKKARATADTFVVPTRIGTQIEPGQTRWQVIEQLLEQGGLLARSSADGRELIIAPPNYGQEIQFRFFRPSPGSTRAAESTVLELGVKRSTGDRYSRVIVVGSGPGTTVNFGAAPSSRFGQAKNNPATVDGDGLDFTKPKRLVVQRTLTSTAEATEFAEREMAKRDAQGLLVGVRAAGHGQLIARSFTTLFAPDLVALVEDEDTGTNGSYLITSCVYEQNRGASATTTMQLVRKGSVLA